MFEQIMPSVRATIVLAVFTGLVFPLVVSAVAQLCFPAQANGSLITGAGGTVIGSSLLAQSFTKPQYFHPRPSGAGSGYAGEASGGTNYGPTSKKLILGDTGFAGINQLAESYRKENQLADHFQVPVDAVTRSGSGLDPHISVANALIQAARVAKSRSLPPDKVNELVRRYTTQRDLGILGEPGVNVLLLNLALDRQASS